MGIFSGLLTLPVLGAPRLAQWLARTVGEEALRQYLDEPPVRAELLELQQRLDAGEIVEEDYDQAEKALLERINAIRELKAQQGSQAHS